MRWMASAVVLAAVMILGSGVGAQTPSMSDKDKMMEKDKKMEKDTMMDKSGAMPDKMDKGKMGADTMEKDKMMDKGMMQDKEKAKAMEKKQ